MISLGFDSVQAAQLQAKLKSMPGEIMKAVAMGMARAGLEVQNQAKTKAPYQTGNLRRSLTMDPSIVGVRDQVRVGSNLEYARIQDLGGAAGKKRRGRIKAKRYLIGPFEHVTGSTLSTYIRSEIQRVL